MNTSRWVTVVVIILAIVAAVFFWHREHAAVPAAPVDMGANTDSATTSAAVPGDNLTLGQGSSATLGSFLIAYNGMTLYTYGPDTDGTSHCTDSCAANWPPYVVTSTANLVAESPIAGAIATTVRADASTQVTYNGHPLYFYAGDVAAGDTKGQGLGGVWYVVKP